MYQDIGVWVRMDGRGKLFSLHWRLFMTQWVSGCEDMALGRDMTSPT